MMECDLWIEAACRALQTELRPLHYTDIKCHILTHSLVKPGLSTTLDAALAEECIRKDSRLRPTRNQDGFYELTSSQDQVPSVEQKPTSQVIPKREPSNKQKRNTTAKTKAVKKRLKDLPSSDRGVGQKAGKKQERRSKSRSKLKQGAPFSNTTVDAYKLRYQQLKRLAKDIIFINAAYCDEVVYTETQIERVSQQRRWLIKEVHRREKSKGTEKLEESKQTASLQLNQAALNQNHSTSNSTALELSKPSKLLKKSGNQKISSKRSTTVTNGHETIMKTNGKATIGVAEKSRKRRLSIGQVKQKNRRSGNDHGNKTSESPDSFINTDNPLQLGNLTIYSLGKIVTEAAFHSAEHLYPVGFTSRRCYVGLHRGTDAYTCTVRENLNSPEPIFQIESEAEQQLSFHGCTPSECHNKLLNALHMTRGLQFNNFTEERGATFFGLTHPVVQHLLQSLPNARKCQRYEWRNFNSTVSLEEEMHALVDLDSAAIIFTDLFATSCASQDENIAFTSSSVTMASTSLLVPLLPNG